MKTPSLLALFFVGFWSVPPVSAQTNWFMRPSNTSQNLSVVGYGSGRFIACGSGIVLNSTNGTSWTGYNEVNTNVTSLAYWNGTWYGAGTFGSQNFGISVDNGHTWTGKSIAGITVRAIAYGSGTLVAVGDSGYIRYSTDGGLTWNIGLSPTSDGLLSVAYGNGTWVAVGGNNTVVTSSDGQLWSLQNTLPVNTAPTHIGYGAGTFVITGGFSDNILTSTNGGVNWVDATSPTSAYANADYVAFGNGTWVGCGVYGRVVVSANAGQTWVLANSGISINLNSVVYGNGMWVAVGNNGTIISSQASTNGGPPLVTNLQIQRAVELDWLSQVGSVYQVQFSTNFSNWQSLGTPILGDGLAKKFYDGINQATNRFYRIQIQ